MPPKQKTSKGNPPAQPARNTTGDVILYETMAILVARMVLVVFPLIYIYGARQWITLGWYICFVGLAGGHFLVYLGVCINSWTRSTNHREVFGPATTWFTLRRFYVFFGLSLVDVAAFATVIGLWLKDHSVYEHTPIKYTPSVNTNGYFTFEMICVSFVFTTIIWFIHGVMLVRAIWKDEEVYLENNTLATDKRALFIDANKNTAKGVKLESMYIKIYAFFAFLTILTVMTLLFMYFVLIFWTRTVLNLYVFVGFVTAATIFYLIYVGMYYTYVRQPLLNDVTQDNMSTDDTRRELDAENIALHIFLGFTLAVQWMFFVYYWTLETPSVKFDKMPHFQPDLLVQRPSFYVLLDQAAMNSGFLAFTLVYSITFLYTGDWNTYGGNVIPERLVKSKYLNLSYSKSPGIHIFINMLLSVFYFLFLSFILMAITGSHWIVQNWENLTIAYTITGAVVVGCFSIMLGIRWSGLSKDVGVYYLNGEWVLITWKLVVGSIFAYLLGFVIFVTTTAQYDELRDGEWEKILEPTTTPVSYITVYYPAAINALYVTSLVFLVSIVNSITSTSVRYRADKENATLLTKIAENE